MHFARQENLSTAMGKGKRISSYFSCPSKKIKLNHKSESNQTLEKSCSETEELSLNQSNETQKERNASSVNPERHWKLLKAENFNTKYTKLFSSNVAGNFLERLEKEVEYFTGNLLKVKVFGKWHDIPRKQVSFGDPGLTYKFSGNCIPALPWIPVILELKEAVEDAMKYKFNFVLLNRYKDGSDYIGEHRDDEKELVADAPIASLSFGQPRDFIFKHKDSRGVKATRKIDSIKLELEHGSLLVMYPPSNSYWYHSLPARKKAHNVRVNLTFRRMV